MSGPPSDAKHELIFAMRIVSELWAVDGQPAPGMHNIVEHMAAERDRSCAGLPILRT